MDDEGSVRYGEGSAGSSRKAFSRSGERIDMLSMRAARADRRCGIKGWFGGNILLCSRSVSEVGKGVRVTWSAGANVAEECSGGCHLQTSQFTKSTIPSIPGSAVS